MATKTSKNESMQVENLSLNEIERIKNDITQTAEVYNIPGVSPETVVENIERDNDFVSISQVGGNIRVLELGGESIYFSGRDPYVKPYLENGVLKFASPEFYRFIGHHILPVANKFPGFNEEAHKMLEEITGQTLRRDYNTGHHGISQCRIGEVSKENGVIKYRVLHYPDNTNLFRFEEIMVAGFDGEWFREEISISNPNDFPIPISLLRHPYFLVPEEGFGKATIKILSQSNNSITSEILFSLNNYETQGEQRFDGIPLLQNGQLLEFDRGDGVILQIGFEGDYNSDTSGVQIFSNGFSRQKIVDDYMEKHKIHQKRLVETVTLLRTLGLNTDWYSTEAIHGELQLHSDTLNPLRSICIEDNTSKGNIYADLNSNPVILQPGESKTFVRVTRRVN